MLATAAREQPIMESCVCGGHYTDSDTRQQPAELFTPEDELYGTGGQSYTL